MLSPILGKPRMEETQLLEDAVRAIGVFRSDLKKLIDQQTRDCGRYTRFDLWCRGFVSALSELEWSVRGAATFSEPIRHKYEEAMDAEEASSYHNHLYFQKNAYIRMFSILDKLGYFLNDMYRLETERVKAKFSYFTVLRQMKHRKEEPDLEQQLFQLKTKFKEPMERLRVKRNMEVHHINAEMLDDLQRTDLCKADRTYIEDLDACLSDLRAGYEMVCLTLTTSFHYFHRHTSAK
ncbi:Cthe_2314 family HEPN domain-containing protein [Paenibacillus koleovorans]|uniref:Cthe_2314 family HEPN domain-containing protein n=1 Tax=Paenibacillus koleovorans TaxID=121608 RepID=UPI000FD98484|nr:Cthe_2314 family HEPN domain-containing protein [Paenibacillus koleovorans]